MIGWVRARYRRKRFGEDVVVVSGLPRSGTSMAMRMLAAGGVPLFTDGIRQADEDNPRGYFEYEKIKSLERDPEKNWLPEARGKAVKVVSELLPALPSTCLYRVIFINRDLGEVIASQNKMLLRRGEPLAEDDARIEVLFERHLRVVKSWVKRQKNFELLEIEYREVVADPLENARRIRDFLGLPLDPARMAVAVDTSLYRNRR